MRLLFVGVSVAAVVASGLVLSGANLKAQQLASESVDVPRGEMALGSVNIPRRVMANGQALPAGDYDVQLTPQAATPGTVGALDVLERWVEFRQGSDVKGREVVTIVPSDEIGGVAKSAAPGTGGSRVELLRENEYMRVWINQGGTHYLIHLVVG